MAITIKSKPVEPPKLLTVKEQIAIWRNGSAGFLRWLEDVQPVILDEHGKFSPYKIPSDHIRQEIETMLDGGFKTVVISWPRRHGKTILTALIILWRFTTRPNEQIALMANSDKQALGVPFKIIRTAIERTPYLRALKDSGAIEIFDSGVVKYSAVGSTITSFPNSLQSLYGYKFSIVQASELHAGKSIEMYNVLAGSLLDREDGLLLVDSTVGAKSSPLYIVWQAWKDQVPGIHWSYISYPSLEAAIAALPPWLSENGLRGLAATMLPASFSTQHLNQWSEGTNVLFPKSVIDRCVENYSLDVKELTNGQAYFVGGGLDRSYGFSLHGDATVTTCVLKTLLGDEEVFYVLDSSEVRFASAGGIKSNITNYHRRFNLKKMAIESYNAGDIAAWASEQPFESEVVHPTAERQSNAFTALFNAANEGRLRIHPQFDKLLYEMSIIEYFLEGDVSKGTLPKFSAPKNRHDDFVYSLLWAMFSLRDQTLNPYEITGIHCEATGPVARICCLNGSNSVPACAEDCPSMRQVNDLHKRYLSRGMLVAMGLPEFFASKVRNIGSHTVRR